MTSVFATQDLPPADEDGPVTLTTDDRTFETLEQAVRRTPLGRWFMREAERRARSDDTRSILNAIEGLRVSMDAERSAATMDVVNKELRTMAEAISQTRTAIASIKPDVAGSNRIMAATEELDTIVTATERATSDILGAAENIQSIVVDMRETDVPAAICDKLEAEAIDIFTACTFQDITGQRTTKVVNVLRYLEQRVNSMIEIWGVPDPNSEEPEDKALMSGPAREGEGVSQDDIDRMLSDFGNPEPEAAAG